MPDPWLQDPDVVLYHGDVLDTLREIPAESVDCVVTSPPFIGSGTVAFVARKLGRHAIGIDLSESYLQLAAKRLQQQSLFAGIA